MSQAQESMLFFSFSQKIKQNKLERLTLDIISKIDV
jgi:hypothetical protein